MTAPPAPLSIVASRRLTGWLAEVDASLALTTYQAGKLFFIGRQGDRLALHERTFPRCMGLCTGPGGELWVATLWQLWRLSDALGGEVGRGEFAGCDRLYVPRVAYTTGDCDIHDVAILGDGRPVFVNTRFSCLATVSDRASFTPLWRPPWISRLAAEDRCHLNGLAVANGAAAYVSAVARSDVADGWREQRVGGGVIVEVASGEVIAAGLAMPHSPRLHAGELWILEAGSGYLGVIDRRRGTFERRVFCPGYARGLAFVGGYAVVGVSAIRDSPTFAALPLGDALDRRGVVARCALLIIDLARGDIVDWLRFDGLIHELYDVTILPGIARPQAVGLQGETIQRVITIAEP